MIRIVMIIISLKLGIIGIVMLLQTYKVLRRILYGAETSRRVNIITAVNMGISLFICFFALELLMATLNSDHIWIIKSILIMVVLPAAGGLIVILGVLWQIFAITKYRGFLYRKISEIKKGDEEKH